MANTAIVENQGDGIIIRWHDGSESFFHHFWLRDCCYCKTCGDPRTGKRFLLPSDISLDAKPRSVDITEQQKLLIVWQVDGHLSRYSLSWLRDNRYSASVRVERFHRPITWGAEISTNLPTVCFEEVRGNELCYLDLLRKLRDFGFVVIRDGPRDAGAVTTIGKLVGDLKEATYGTVVDITPLSRPVTLADTTMAQTPHTDEGYRYAPPGIIVFYCATPAADGGDTILVDGYHIANELRRADREAFELLATQPQTFARTVDSDGIDLRSRATVFVTNELGDISGIRFSTRSTSPLDVPEDKMKPLHAAKRMLSTLMLSEDNQIIIGFRPGDSLLFDNHRVLHGRTAFSDPNRFIRQCNVLREQFHERLRCTSRRVGCVDEANQILPAGAVG